MSSSNFDKLSVLYSKSEKNRGGGYLHTRFSGGVLEGGIFRFPPPPIRQACSECSLPVVAKVLEYPQPYEHNGRSPHLRPPRRRPAPQSHPNSRWSTTWGRRKAVCAPPLHGHSDAALQATELSPRLRLMSPRRRGSDCGASLRSRSPIWRGVGGAVRLFPRRVGSPAQSAGDNGRLPRHPRLLLRESAERPLTTEPKVVQHSAPKPDIYGLDGCAQDGIREQLRGQRYVTPDVGRRLV